MNTTYLKLFNKNRLIFYITVLICSFLVNPVLGQQNSTLQKIPSPVLFTGGENMAYRDPAILYHDNEFHLFFTLVEIEPDGYIYSYVAYSKSRDLVQWTGVCKLTEKNQKLNYSSPGNIIRFNNEWILCFQTYPRPDYTGKQEIRFGDETARLFIMRSRDLESWSKPELLKVKGDDVLCEDMGRMIDPYIVQDKEEPDKYWCFYKQNGVSLSYSRDLKSWTFFGHTSAGENACVIVENDEYILFHSPNNGIGMKKSTDLTNWTDWGELITLGQDNWEWAKGRITAGTVINLKHIPGIKKYIMFFHGSGPLTEGEGDFDRNSSIGIAWSDNLKNWEWPGK